MASNRSGKRNGNFDDIPLRGSKKRENERQGEENEKREKPKKKYERFMEYWSLKQKKWKIFREGIEINIDFQ